MRAPRSASKSANGSAAFFGCMANVTCASPAAVHAVGTESASYSWKKPCSALAPTPPLLACTTPQPRRQRLGVIGAAKEVQGHTHLWEPPRGGGPQFTARVAQAEPADIGRASGRSRSGAGRRRDGRAEQNFCRCRRACRLGAAGQRSSWPAHPGAALQTAVGGSEAPWENEKRRQALQTFAWEWWVRVCKRNLLISGYRDNHSRKDWRDELRGDLGLLAAAAPARRDSTCAAAIHEGAAPPQLQPL